MGDMTLDVQLTKKRHFFNLDVSFSCPEKKMLVLVGPSGGGKTTLVRLLAGLDKPDEGTITFGDEVWFDSGRNIFVPPQKRRLGYVFQEFTLFPNLTLYENAAFAAPDKAGRKEVEGLLELFQIAHLRDRKPHMVSGGERQRCAICQALIRRPRVLLMDEPFSALDVATRRNLREELNAIKKDLSFPVVYVTHDINEALYLADDILPIVEGKEDRNWMQRSIRGHPGRGKPMRADREQRPALAY
jgi:molybdate transport system ATP-binding protein